MRKNRLIVKFYLVIMNHLQTEEFEWKFGNSPAIDHQTIYV